MPPNQHINLRHTGSQGQWDHSSNSRFYEYYVKESLSDSARQRFISVRDVILRAVRSVRQTSEVLDVADIGCGAGTQCLIWSQLGHRVHGLDINQPLLEIARKRGVDLGYTVDFRIGSATSLPWPNDSMDVCIATELLEHVALWEQCLDELARVLRPGGILFLTTTNLLCPVQQEFELPLYSWYPGVIKRYFEHLAVTSHPKLANYATYPAVNWFTFFSLRTYLRKRDLDCLDRFDVTNAGANNGFVRCIILSIRRLPPIRWLAHVFTPGTILLGVKANADHGKVGGPR